MANPSRTHPAPERLAALARGEVNGDAAAALRRHLDHCASCRAVMASNGGGRSAEETTFHLATEPLAPAKATESLPPPRKPPAGRVRKRRPRQQQSLPVWILCSGIAAVVGLLLIAVSVGVLLLDHFRPAAAPAEQAQAPPPAAAAAVAPEQPVRAVPPPEPAKAPAAPAPAPPAAAPAPHPPGVVPAQPAPQPPGGVPAPPLTPEEQRWQPTFGARLASYGRAACASDKLAGKPLTGVLVYLDVKAQARRAPLNRTTLAALDKTGRRLPAAAFFWKDFKPGGFHAPAGVAVEAFPGDVSIGGQRCQFFSSRFAMGGPGDGVSAKFEALQEVSPVIGQDYLVDRPITFEQGPGLEYDLGTRGFYIIGLLFAEDLDQLTAVRVLGHVLPLDGTARDNGKPVAVGSAPGRPRARRTPAGPAAAGPVPAEAAPAEMPADRAEANPEKADEPDVYHHVPAVDVTSKSRNIWVRQDGPDSWKVGAVGASGEVAADANGDDVRLVPDALGSTGLQVIPGRLGYTTLAGLRFYQRARLNIWDDGTVEVDQIGLRAKGEDGDNYIAQRVKLPRRTAVVMVRLEAKATEGPKSVELTEEERNERAAASKLRTAKELLEDGKRDRARALCEEILKTYPQTKAAPEAKKLLGD